MPDVPKRYPNRLILETLFNIRDLGGFPAAEGRITAYGRFLRSDAPVRLSDSDLQKLLEYPVQTIIDLRSQSEIKETLCPLRDCAGFEYVNIPLLGADMMASMAAMNEQEDQSYISILGLYVGILEKAREPIGRVFSKLADTRSGACLFHCTHGKDRTGIVAALLLMLAGVADEDIIANYQVSATFLKPWFDTFIDNLPTEIHHFFKTEPESMEMTLRYFHQSYDSVEEYLIGCGVSPAEIACLRQRLLD